MLVCSDHHDLPARKLRKIGHLVQENPLHPTGIIRRVNAIDEFHRLAHATNEHFYYDVCRSSSVFSSLAIHKNRANTKKTSVETLNHITKFTNRNNANIDLNSANRFIHN